MIQERDVTPYHFATPAVIKHDVYLYDDIGGAQNYVELIQALDNATDQEIFNIRVATGGGDLDGCIALIHAIRRTQAVVIGHADSIVASAGTIIFLACQSWYISEFAYFMFHDGSAVSAGKFNETKKQITAISNLYARIADKIYKPFFSQEEIEKIMDGSDVYLTSDEMAERINKAFPDAELEVEYLDGQEDTKPELIVEADQEYDPFEGMFENLPSEEDVLGHQELHDGSSTVVVTDELEDNK